jgi:uncharacterized protein
MGKFQIFNGRERQIYFNLKSMNGEIIAASQAYTTKQSAEYSIAAIKHIAAPEEVIDFNLSNSIKSTETVERAIL